MIKDVPIKTIDGVNIKVGMPIFTVNTKQVSSYKDNPKYYIKSKTGKSKVYIVENEVINVNQASNARTFTIRSDRGCEHTYSVRDSCLTGVFGKRINAKKEAKEMDLEDCENIQAKIDTIKNDIVRANKRIKTWESVKKKLASVKH